MASAADKRCRVYPSNLHADAVGLYPPASAVPTQEKFIEVNVHIKNATAAAAVPTDSSSFQQALTDSWFIDSWSRTAVHVLMGEKKNVWSVVILLKQRNSPSVL
ncbi:hypothetical protein TNCV_4762661 [Trichonephila clavipes]|nr:hypothetical protein TNCV_4762661 [Trichonephila clavipes]